MVQEEADLTHLGVQTDRDYPIRVLEKRREYAEVKSVRRDSNVLVPDPLAC